jgi:hypothetical protein
MCVLEYVYSSTYSCTHIRIHTHLLEYAYMYTEFSDRDVNSGGDVAHRVFAFRSTVHIRWRPNEMARADTSEEF